MRIAISLLPVVLFLAFLFLLDSFKLVRKATLVASLLWGTGCAGLAYFINTSLSGYFSADAASLSKYIAPLAEEMLKGAFILFLVARKKTGFSIDAAIYGFAVGTGFSLVENLYYLLTYPGEQNLLVWIIRGFGTAVMHGGCTAILSVVLITGVNRSRKASLAVLPGLLAAILMHSAFNHLLNYPLYLTLFFLVFLPSLFILIFNYSKKSLQHWLEVEFNDEVQMLVMVQRGEFLSTRAGQYLLTIRDKFDRETVVDMYCYISLFLELSIKAKRNLMLRENDFPVIIENDLQEKMVELSHLRKRIGKAGEYALSPLIRMNYRSLWKINQLKE